MSIASLRIRLAHATSHAVMLGRAPRGISYGRAYREFLDLKYPTTGA